MSHLSVRYSIVVVAGCALVGWGCWGGPSRVQQITMDPAGSAAKAMEKYDTNKDGKIAGAELDACPALKNKDTLLLIDTNKDGAVDAAEIEARVNAWKESRVGRMGMNVKVLRKGQPVEGVEVKFVPEDFLGDSFQVGAGKTDKSGVARISMPLSDPEDPPGISPGFYRVEITGPNVAEKYNTKTTLGLEVSQEAQGNRSGATFNID